MNVMQVVWSIRANAEKTPPKTDFLNKVVIKEKKSKSYKNKVKIFLGKIRNASRIK